MHKIVFAVLIAVLVQGVCVAAPPPNDPAALNKIMTEIGGAMIELYPVIVLQRELKAPEQHLLRAKLKQLARLFRDARPHIQKRSDTYQVSYDFMLDYLADTQRAVDEKDIYSARSRLYGLGSICVSCHTQDTTLRTLFTGAKRDKFEDDGSYAEFSFLTRNYADAETYFDRDLRTRKNQAEYDVIRPLQRMVIIYAQVLNQPGVGADKLSRYLSLPAHTEATRSQLSGWIKGLRAWEMRRPRTTPTFAEIEAQVRDILGPLDRPLNITQLSAAQEIPRVWLTGALYHYLNGTPQPDEIPPILYWLAVTERSAGYNYFYSLADLYLKECVHRFPDHSYAPRCYAEYEEYVKFTHTGTGGLVIPPDIQQQLIAMKRALDAVRTPEKKK